MNIIQNQGNEIVQYAHINQKITEKYNKYDGKIMDGKVAGRYNRTIKTNRVS